MSKKLIVFDFDGTLSDFKKVGSAILSEFSVSKGLVYDVEKFYIGYVDPLKYDLGWGVALDKQLELLEQWVHFNTEQMVKYHKFIPPLFDHAEEILLELSKDYDLSVITARDRLTFLTSLEHHNLSHYFQIYRSCCCMIERDKKIKPYPDAVHCLIGESGHSVEDIVVIGDTTSDIDMANNAGAKSIAVSWGLHPREKLAAANPTLVLDKLTDLPDAVRKIFA